MRIGIFGGSFNPPHKGHVRLAREMKNFLSLDTVYIVPAASSPFKDGCECATNEERLELCRLTFTDNCFCVSDFEINRGGKSYTIYTLEHFKKEFPDAELFLFMGDDMLMSLDRWYKSADILELATVCAMRRDDDHSAGDLRAYAHDVLKAQDRVIVLDAVPVEISSTEIRRLAKSGGEYKNYLTREAAEFIESRAIYER